MKIAHVSMGERHPFQQLGLLLPIGSIPTENWCRMLSIHKGDPKTLWGDPKAQTEGFRCCTRCGGVTPRLVAIVAQVVTKGQPMSQPSFLYKGGCNADPPQRLSTICLLTLGGAWTKKNKNKKQNHKATFHDRNSLKWVHFAWIL